MSSYLSRFLIGICSKGGGGLIEFSSVLAICLITEAYSLKLIQYSLFKYRMKSVRFIIKLMNKSLIAALILLGVPFGQYMLRLPISLLPYSLIIPKPTLFTQLIYPFYLLLASSSIGIKTHVPSFIYTYYPHHILSFLINSIAISSFYHILTNEISSYSLQQVNLMAKNIQILRYLNIEWNSLEWIIQICFSYKQKARLIGFIIILMNKGLITALIVLGVASVYLYTLDNAAPEVSSFDQFKTNFGKTYLKEEELYRKNIFLSNVAKIEAHNANAKSTYLKGINKFTDLTEAEFESIYLTLKVPVAKPRVQDVHPIVGDVDWSAAGKVTGVKNQGSCGSCWAFSATASLESALRIADKQGLLSEQELVDCSREFGNQGCNGGWMDSAFDYIVKYNINSQDNYPYVARDQACKKKGGEFSITGYVDVEGCTELANALAQRPISVAVDASVWSSYRSGILKGCQKNINHGVLLVGVTADFWRIKNSWGVGWGESGFIRLSPGDTCALCQYPSYPTVA